jgi:hypothetical protein
MLYDIVLEALYNLIPMICKPIKSDAMHDWVSEGFIFLLAKTIHLESEMKFHLDCILLDYFISLLLVLIGIGGVETIQA